MGCSASREDHDFIHPQNVSNSVPGSGSGSGSNPITRTLSLPTPLVHHRAVREGDTNHLVLLTSSTYGSLLLIDRPAIPNPNPNLGKSENGSDPLEPLSPDSVVNTWELMEGLDDDFGFHLVESPKIPILEKEISLNKMLKSYEFVEHSDAELFQLKGNEDRIVLYYTSLRGIRKTYEDCCDVRMIFRALGVCVDERDMSMDSSYRKELQGVFGGGKAVSLPQVFIGGRHIGGVNEIKQLNEAGELPKLLKGFPLKKDGLLCGSCGDARFMPCPTCNGSRKLFKNEQRMLRRCLDCNENGLIRCPFCCP